MRIIAIRAYEGALSIPIEIAPICDGDIFVSNGDVAYMVRHPFITTLNTLPPPAVIGGVISTENVQQSVLIIHISHIFFPRRVGHSITPA